MPAYFVLQYDYVGDVVERRAPLREAHLKLAREARARGELLLGGALADPVDSGLLVFRVDDRAIVERFVREDPYVRGGIVRAWRVRPWTVVIGGEDQADAAKTGT
ncbi:MAG TPA: YciI-like protein [Vicinamibacteria bacterium]|nr:YciI-like protein [Vicinamibacteria bacterium]